MVFPQLLLHCKTNSKTKYNGINEVVSYSAVALNASLRARHMARTDARSWVTVAKDELGWFIPSAICSAASSVRRNGLYSFSAPIVDGHYTQLATK